MRILVDTNILGRLSQRGHPMHGTAVRAVEMQDEFDRLKSPWPGGHLIVAKSEVSAP
jgi:hypothetical protein